MSGNTTEAPLSRMVRVQRVWSVYGALLGSGALCADRKPVSEAYYSARRAVCDCRGLNYDGLFFLGLTTCGCKLTAARPTALVTQVLYGGGGEIGKYATSEQRQDAMKPCVILDIGLGFGLGQASTHTLSRLCAGLLFLYCDGVMAFGLVGNASCNWVQLPLFAGLLLVVVFVPGCCRAYSAMSVYTEDVPRRTFHGDSPERLAPPRNTKDWERLQSTHMTANRHNSQTKHQAPLKGQPKSQVA